MKEELALNSFFLTIVNYTLPENIEKYIKHLKSIPEESSHYKYAKWLSEGLEYRYGQTGKHSFTKKDFKSFEHDRSKISLTLDVYRLQDKNSPKLKYGQDESEVFTRYGELLPRCPHTDCGKAIGNFSAFPWDYGKNLSDEKVKNKLMGSNFQYVLECVINLGCYSLTQNILVDEKNPDSIKRCDECKKYFIPKRLRKDIHFCSDKCRLASNNRKDIESGKRAATKRESFGWNKLSDEVYFKRYGKERSNGKR